MASRKEKVNAGLFLLIGIVLLGGAIAIVGGLNLERRGDGYLIKIPKSVGGLREGAAVKYLGVNVGRVTKVDFPAEDVESVRVFVEITRRSTPIKKGTFASLTSNFLTGETSVDLQGGTNDEPSLVPGSILAWRPTTLMRLEDSLPGVIDELKHVVAGINQLLGPENQTRVAKLVDDVDALANEVRGQVAPLAHDLQGLRADLSDASRQVAAAAGGIRSDVGDGVAKGASSLESAAKSIEALTAKLSRVADQLESGADGVPALVASVRETSGRLGGALASTQRLVDENGDSFGRTLIQLQSTARELELLIEQLQRNPSDLVFSDPPPEHRRGERAATPDKSIRGGS